MKKILKKLTPKKEKILKIIKLFFNFVIIFIALIIIFSTNWTIKNCQFDNFDQILFTLNSSVTTASNSMVNDFIVDNILVPFIITIVILIINLLIKYIFRKKNAYLTITIIKLNKTIKLNFKTILKLLLLFSLFGYSIYYAISNLYIFNYIKYSYIESNFFEVSYKDPKTVELEFPKKKRNLIYIFLESMESTYTNKENGGAYDFDYMEELRELAKNNINFSNTSLVGGAHMPFGASWTIAATIAQTSGVPLKSNFAQNDEKSYKNGLVNGAYAIGEILKKEGYRNYIMVGSDLTFGGRRVYYKEHGDYKVYDYYTAIKDNIIDDGYYVNWGYEDKKLFEYAKEELTKISKSNKPFNFTMLTADTHFSDGYMDNSCEIISDDHYLNSVHCSSKKLNDFINWIKKQSFYKNTTIILVGDHLSMNTYSFEEIDPNYERSVYNVFINSAIDTNCNKNRSFNTFDYYPTTLAALGVKIEGERLGLGTNLFSCKETLSEEYGNDYIDERLKEKSLYYNKCISNKCKKN